MDKYSYILIEVAERNIDAPELFPDLESAQKSMLEAFLDVMGLAKEYPVNELAFKEVIGQLAENGILEDETDISETTAYTTRHGANYDWKIFNLDEIM